MTTIPRFYVYVLARPNGKPFYVGKGTGDRIVRHEVEARNGHKCHKCNIIRKIWASGGEVQRYTVLTTDDEQEALDYEVTLIALFGASTLANQTSGGESGTLSDEARAKVSAALRGVWKRPEYRALRSAQSKAALATPEARERLSAALKKALSDPEYRARRSAERKQYFSDPENRRRLSEITKKASNTPEAKANHAAAQRREWADPDKRAKRQQNISAAASTPKAKERSKDRQAALWADPEWRERTKAAINSPEARARKSAACKAKWQEPGHAEKVAAGRRAAREAKAAKLKAEKSPYED